MRESERAREVGKGVRPDKFPISGKRAKSLFWLKIRNLFTRSWMTKWISSLEFSCKI